jgi:phospholipid/cholesterol/gamma-HCH transport system permease protein
MTGARGTVFSVFGALLARLGRPVVAAARWAIDVCAMAAAILMLAMRASSWRRTVTRAFARDLRAALFGSLPAASVLAAMVGLGLVYQALYWLGSAGQISLIGEVIVTVLLRELAPMMVALIVIGRSGTALLIELTQQRTGGQLRTLDGQGIDPFLVYVVPRTLAFAVASFTLTILFIVATLLFGFISASALGVVQLSFHDFVDTTIATMSVGDFVILPAKSLALGFAIGVICCHTALTHRRDATRVVASGFVRAVLAAVAVSGMLTLAI